MKKRASTEGPGDSGTAASSLAQATREEIKATGTHYTPSGLARYLARLAIDHARSTSNLVVLDPACGDGSLLEAIATEAGPDLLPMHMVAIDRDARSVERTAARLAQRQRLTVDARVGDFLEIAAGSLSRAGHLPFTSAADQALGKVDLVIANPPYVRTQVLGADEAQRLAAHNGLSGRVDLYHAFVSAMALSLRPGGTLALLCSNRFLSTLAGQSVRDILEASFEIEQVVDLGDTKLFGAAVLPAIVIATKSDRPTATKCPFARVYEVRPEKCPDRNSLTGVLESLTGGAAEFAREEERYFEIERGTLSRNSGHGHSWTLASEDSEAWLRQIRTNTFCTLGDVAHVKVGIKTTADSVFIRTDWTQLESEMQPEPELLRSLITHRVAKRWKLDEPQHRVLYPHVMSDGRRAVIELARFPKAQAYLTSHRERLEGRKYVIEAGRHWYEIWVPHSPEIWSQPKIVWPDISESARFALDRSGAVVNGDCYWLTLKAGYPHEWLPLILAVANSSVARRFYDTVCGNRLYAGRRRYITQYVSQFPLPDLSSRASRNVIEEIGKALADGELRAPVEEKMDALVNLAFGFSE